MGNGTFIGVFIISLMICAVVIIATAKVQTKPILSHIDKEAAKREIITYINKTKWDSISDDSIIAIIRLHKH